MTTANTHLVTSWTQYGGYADTGIRATSYAEAEAHAARLHHTRNGEASRPEAHYLPMTLARAVELRAVWGGSK